MSDDLVKRLRSRTVMVNYGHGDVRDIPDEECEEAANYIEQLEDQLAQSQFIRWAARFEEQSDRIEKLEADLEVATMKRLLDSNRIEKLEAALREIVDRAEHRMGHAVSDDVCVIARKALEGKDD